MAHSGKEPMPEILPGTYPGEAPPGLEATVQAAQAEQEAQQPVRQRNRLQKAATPRTHSYNDPGVAATDTEPLLGASKPDEPILTTSNEPGASDYTWDSSTPRGPLESIRSALHTATPEPEIQDQGQTRDSQPTGMAREGKMAAPVIIGGMASTGGQKTMETTDRTTKSTASAPYWGDVGKGKETETTTRSPGGVAYGRTEPQPSMPQEAEPLEKPMTAGISNPPSGGVYNTVIGHGSQDNESTHPKSTTTRMGDTQVATTAPSDDDAMLAVPLDDIPEERSKASRQTPSMDSRENAPSFARDETRREAMMTTKPASREMAHEESPPKINMASRPSYPHVETRPQQSQPRTRQSTSPSRYWTEESPVLGRPPAISQPIGTPSSGSSAEHPTTARMPAQPHSQHTGYQPTTITTRPPAERVKTRDDDSIKSEKRHSFLSMFHRHKREEPTKDTAAATQRPERSDKISNDDSSSEDKPWSPIVADMEYMDQNPGPGMKKAAAWEAAGVASVMGMLHRGKTISGGSSERRKSSISHPMSPRTGAPGVESKGMRQEGVSAPFEHPREPPSPPARREHGTFGPTSLSAPQIPKRASTTKEHGTYGMPTTMAVPDPDITRGDVASREYTKYNRFSSPTAHTAEHGMTAPSSGMQTGPASTTHPEHKHLHTHFTPTSEDIQQSQRAGISDEPHTFLGAPMATHSHGTRPDPSQESVPGMTTYAQPPAEHTKTPDSYTAPPPHHYRQERETTTTSSMLPGAAAADTPTTGLSPPPARSQVHTAQYPSHPQMTQDMSRETKPEPYQGPTPLKVHKHGAAAASTSPTETSSQTHAQPSTMHYPPASQTAKGMSPEVMPDSHTASSPRTEHTTAAAAAATAAAAAAGVTMASAKKAPSSQTTKGMMSPEVMPDSYTASSPRIEHTTTTTPAAASMPSTKMGTTTPSTKLATPQQQQRSGSPPEHTMSPEVMPSSYTASAIPHTPSKEPKEDAPLSPAGNIAMGMAAIGSGLAAAMGLGGTGYGTKTGKEQDVDTELAIGQPGTGMGQEMGMHVGGSSRGRTVIRCERCGCENDISEVVEMAVEARRGRSFRGRRSFGE